jgi:hypothetical protein
MHSIKRNDGKFAEQMPYWRIQKAPLLTGFLLSKTTAFSASFIAFFISPKNNAQLI